MVSGFFYGSASVNIACPLPVDCQSIASRLPVDCQSIASQEPVKSQSRASQEPVKSEAIRSQWDWARASTLRLVKACLLLYDPQAMATKCGGGLNWPFKRQSIAIKGPAA